MTFLILFPVRSLWTVCRRWHNELPLGPLALSGKEMTSASMPASVLVKNQHNGIRCHCPKVKKEQNESNFWWTRWQKAYDFWTNIGNSLNHKHGINHVAWRNAWIFVRDLAFWDGDTKQESIQQFGYVCKLACQKQFVGSFFLPLLCLISFLARPLNESKMSSFCRPWSSWKQLIRCDWLMWPDSKHSGPTSHGEFGL